MPKFKVNLEWQEEHEAELIVEAESKEKAQETVDLEPIAFHNIAVNRFLEDTFQRTIDEKISVEELKAFGKESINSHVTIEDGTIKSEYL